MEHDSCSVTRHLCAVMAITIAGFGLLQAVSIPFAQTCISVEFDNLKSLKVYSAAAIVFSRSLGYALVGVSIGVIHVVIHKIQSTSRIHSRTTLRFAECGAPTSTLGSE